MPMRSWAAAPEPHHMSFHQRGEATSERLAHGAYGRPGSPVTSGSLQMETMYPSEPLLRLNDEMGTVV